MVHIREVVKEIMKSIVIIDCAGAYAPTLFNTLRLKMNPIFICVLLAG